MKEGKTRPIGMTAGYALRLLDYESFRGEKVVEWFTKKNGTHPTRAEAKAWLRTLDSNTDIVND